MKDWFRYTERRWYYQVVLNPTGDRDDLNIQAALDFLSTGKLGDIQTDARGWQSVELRFRDERKWKWPWQRKTLIELGPPGAGGKVMLLEGTFDISNPIMQE